jgi:hypothetical protein
MNLDQGILHTKIVDFIITFYNFAIRDETGSDTNGYYRY